MGLGLAVVGTVFLGLRILDVVSDPLIGWISDQLPRHWGRRKLPMAVGAVIGAPALVMVFTPPPDVTSSYLILWGGLLFLAWTAIQIPYIAWAGELEPGYEARADLNGYREGAGLVGILATGALGVIMASSPEIERFGFLAWTTVVLGALIFFLTLRYVPEGVTNVRRKISKLTLPFENKIFLRVLSAWFVNGLANGLPAVCLPLYMTHILTASENEKAVLLFIYFLFAVLGVQLWVLLSRRYGKHRIWCLSMAVASVSFVAVLFLQAGDVLAFGVICALTGLTLGSDLALPPAIQADCADWDRYRFKKERTGSLFAYWSMSTKLALGLAVGIAFPVLAWFGLDSNTLSPPDISKQALIVIYALVPIVLKAIAIAMMWNFPIGRHQHRALELRLERRT